MYRTLPPFFSAPLPVAILLVIYLHTRHSTLRPTSRNSHHHTRHRRPDRHWSSRLTRHLTRRVLHTMSLAAKPSVASAFKDAVVPDVLTQSCSIHYIECTSIYATSHRASFFSVRGFSPSSLSVLSVFGTCCHGFIVGSGGLTTLQPTPTRKVAVRCIKLDG